MNFRSVRIAAFPQAMSKPTPTTETLLFVSRHAADRHDVAEMAVGHQCGALGPARDVLELSNGLGVMFSEDDGLEVRFHPQIKTTPEMHTTCRGPQTVYNART